jgi:hypothetical protein
MEYMLQKKYKLQLYDMALFIDELVICYGKLRSSLSIERNPGGIQKSCKITTTSEVVSYSEKV